MIVMRKSNSALDKPHALGLLVGRHMCCIQGQPVVKESKNNLAGNIELRTYVLFPTRQIFLFHTDSEKHFG
ncbi:hypothetical protein RvY_05563 [Ramazzottius varieornatus]|uniref:Uncharacterized protein n=1 Tax=Ramazzottius varieornatus TaxID=947166 RepID=A0A1D1UW10_RAMVA|nr:hypothetical protein RvY_05563 [Ramazzottius varieornatus]